MAEMALAAVARVDDSPGNFSVSESCISASLSSMVATRARRRCEYCLIHEAGTFIGFQIDHIISEKHGGPTEPDNLAYACLFCNIYKGSDIASLDAHGRIVPLFHPRQDQWEEHFRFAGPHIEGSPPAESPQRGCSASTIRPVSRNGLQCRPYLNS